MSTSRSWVRRVHVVVLPACLLLIAGAAPVAGHTERISLSENGAQLGLESVQASLSAKGRYVSFATADADVVLGDENGFKDVFLMDRKKGTVERMSLASDGETQGNGDCSLGIVSASGRLVTFSSDADTLVLGDANDQLDAFIHDRKDGSTTRVSVASDGTEGNDQSALAILSKNARLAVFLSLATNFVPNDTNGNVDIFLHDRKTGETSRVSVSSDGSQGNLGSSLGFLSANGRCVSFISAATDLVLGDTNGKNDVFVRDLKTGTTTRVSVSSDGDQGDGDGSIEFLNPLSANGRFVAFVSEATNLVDDDSNAAEDVFVHDRKTGLTTRVSVSSTGEQGAGESKGPSISASGRYVAFHSAAPDLVEGDDNGLDDVFVHDRKTGVTVMASLSLSGTPGDGASQCSICPSISANGRLVAFESDAPDLVDGDDNAVRDVFLRDLKK